MAGANFSSTVATGITTVGCGKFIGDIGILLCGDSNMCGAGAGTRPTLSNTIYEYDNADNSIKTATTSGAYVFNHTLNNGVDEVGPDASFVDKFASERGASQRIVGIPCGDSGSGFTTSQWFDGEEMFDLMQEVTNEFLALDNSNTLGAVLVALGANDWNGATPGPTFQTNLDAFIDAVHGSAFTGNVTQSSFSSVPIVVIGLAPDWYVGIGGTLESIHDVIVATPGRKTYTGYANTDGLSSQSGDDVHLSGAAQITIGSDKAWTAFVAAEGNT